MFDLFFDTSLKETDVVSSDEKKDIRINYKSDKLYFIIGDIQNFDDIN